MLQGAWTVILLNFCSDFAPFYPFFCPNIQNLIRVWYSWVIFMLANEEQFYAGILKFSHFPDEQVVKETIDSSATIEFRPNTADDPHKRKPDISKAKELLNWEPKVSLREGLPLMVSDFQNRILNEDEGKAIN